MEGGSYSKLVSIREQSNFMACLCYMYMANLWRCPVNCITYLTFRFSIIYDVMLCIAMGYPGMKKQVIDNIFFSIWEEVGCG